MNTPYSLFNNLIIYQYRKADQPALCQVIGPADTIYKAARLGFINLAIIIIDIVKIVGPSRFWPPQWTLTLQGRRLSFLVP